MNFWQSKNKINILTLSAISILILCLIAATSEHEKIKPESTFTPSKDIQNLDRKLLIDLQSQEIQFSSQAISALACSNILKQEIIQLFELKNVVYEKCEKANCHYTSYTIEGETTTGKQVSFKLDAGEDGNEVRELKIKNFLCE